MKPKNIKIGIDTIKLSVHKEPDGKSRLRWRWEYAGEIYGQDFITERSNYDDLVKFVQDERAEVLATVIDVASRTIEKLRSLDK